MSVNLMDMVKGAVSDQIMGQIGGLLGQSDTKKTGSMFETAAGSILGGLMKKASTPSGANDVFRAVEDQDDGVLDKLGDILGGGSADEGFMKSGGGVLDMVFGKSNQSGILNAIAKALGIDSGITKKLMAMAAPIVMGVIGKYAKNKALDAVGLGSLLGEQKSVLGNMMPASLTSSLGFGDMLSGASDAVRDAGTRVSGAAGDMGRSATKAADNAANAGGSLLKFLLPLILLGALAWFGYNYFVKGGAADDAANATAKLTEGVDFGDFNMPGLQDKFSGITTAFKNGVTMDNAGALATKITDLTGSIDGMGIGDLPGPAKTAAGSVIGNFIEAIKKAIGGISDDGIMGILQPVIDALMKKLSPLT